LQRFPLRSAGWVRLALPALIAALGVAGYLVTSAAIARDRDAAATRRAEVVSVHAQQLLGRARSLVVGLGNALAGEPRADGRRFAQLAGSTVGSAGLVDALWVAGSEPLRATFTSGTQPELRRGADVTGWTALAAAIRDRSAVYAVTASGIGALGAQRGFYLVQAGRFGSPGYLAVFVPQGWLTLGLDGDPRRLAIDIDGAPLEGDLAGPPAAAVGFDALARHWHIDVGADPRSALLSSLPWIALAWPVAAALVAFLVGRAIMRRRRAERDVERIFDLSVDLLCVAGLDGYFKRVNPAFQQTLGYPAQELTSRPLLAFVHPDDRERTAAAIDELAHGQEVFQFENRYLCRDGSARWLQWSVRPDPDRSLVYGAARDVTEQKRLNDELKASRARVLAAADDTRRRIERDLHDGTQQRLVSLSLALRALEAKAPPGLRDELADSADGLTGAIEELQEFSRGIHPVILTRRGLGPALKALARRSSVPVELDVIPVRLPERVEAAAYYLVSEALTNAAKHAQASHVSVVLRTDGTALDLAIADDGVGGADPAHGSGLMGLRDRVEALGGTLQVAGGADGGTSLRARIPI
jgi:PAS domain S-box-containing protein